MMDGEQLWRCPRRPYFEDPRWFNEVFQAYRWREKGYLSQGGGYDDEVCTFPDLMDVIDTALSDAAEAKQKKEERRRSNVSAGKTPGSAGARRRAR